MRHGYTMVWSGWEDSDRLRVPGGSRVWAKLPIARNSDGSSVVGRTIVENIFDNSEASTLARWLRPDRLILQRIFAGRPDGGPALSSVMVGALNILLDRVTRARLAGDPADVLIAPRVAQIGLVEFHRAAETIELGAQATREALPYIRHALERLNG